MIRSYDRKLLILIVCVMMVQLSWRGFRLLLELFNMVDSPLWQGAPHINNVCDDGPAVLAGLQAMAGITKHG